MFDAALTVELPDQSKTGLDLTLDLDYTFMLTEYRIKTWTDVLALLHSARKTPN